MDDVVATARFVCRGFFIGKNKSHGTFCMPWVLPGLAEKPTAHGTCRGYQSAS